MCAISLAHSNPPDVVIFSYTMGCFATVCFYWSYSTVLSYFISSGALDTSSLGRSGGIVSLPCLAAKAIPAGRISSFIAPPAMIRAHSLSQILSWLGKAHPAKRPIQCGRLNRLGYIPKGIGNPNLHITPDKLVQRSSIRYFACGRWVVVAT